MTLVSTKRGTVTWLYDSQCMGGSRFLSHVLPGLALLGSLLLKGCRIAANVA